MKEAVFNLGFLLSYPGNMAVTGLYFLGCQRLFTPSCWCQHCLLFRPVGNQSRPLEHGALVDTDLSHGYGPCTLSE